MQVFHSSFSYQKVICSGGAIITRKQYRRKMMQFQRNLNKYAKEHGLAPSKHTDRVPTPHFGTVMLAGKYKGQVLSSYEQAWDIVRSTCWMLPAFENIR